MGLKTSCLALTALVLPACTQVSHEALDGDGKRIRAACLKLFGGSPEPRFRGVLHSTGESDGRTVVFELSSDGTMTLDPDTKRPRCTVRYSWWLDPLIPGLGVSNSPARFNGERVIVEGTDAPSDNFTAVTPRADGSLHFERHIVVDNRRIDSSATLTKIR